MRANASLWKKIEESGFKFYCVGCNRERRIHPPAKIGSKLFYLQILITTAILTMAGYPWLGLKGFACLVIPVGIAFEVFYRIKMRAALVCPDCEFDPILYLVDRKKAAHQVERVWRKKFEQRGLSYPEKNQRKPTVPTPTVVTSDSDLGDQA
jgi:hypothetical protein